MLSSKEISAFLRQWNLIQEELPVPTKTGWIAKVTREGKLCMLKLSKNPAEMRALMRYKGEGAVRVIATVQEAVLLERAVPGTPLSDLVRQRKDEEATHIWCDVVEKLHNHSQKEVEFPFVDFFAKDFSVCHPSLPCDLIAEAQEEMDSLLKSQKKPILLHGDLHHDNILYDANRGWLAIDPQGCRGEAEYEVGAFFRNPRDYPEICLNPDVIMGRLDILHKRLGFDQKRMLAWSFCQAVLAAIWSVEDKENPEWALNAARTLRKIRL